MECEDCGDDLITLDEQESGLCAECMSEVYDYDEDDEGDYRYDHERDGY